MRLFDAIGAMVVAAWLGIVGLYIHHVYRAEHTATAPLAEGAVLSEGETWMVLRREDTDVGVLHETRTRLTDGWLVEYELLAQVPILGNPQALRTLLKSTMDERAVLRTFTAEVHIAARALHAQGEVDGQAIRVSFHLGNGQPRQRTLTLDSPPRLAGNAVQQFLASTELTPGATIRHPFFDPTTLSMDELLVEYVGPTELTLYDEPVKAHRFYQQAGQTRMEVIVNDQGEVLIQTMPFGVVAARIPAELGRARAQSMRRKLEEQARKAQGAPQLDDLPIDPEMVLELMQSVAGQTGTQAPDEPAALQPEQGHYRLAGLPDDARMQLKSARQRVLSSDATGVIIATGGVPMDADPVPGPKEPSPDPAHLAMDATIDGTHPAIAKLLAQVPRQAMTLIQAEAAARHVRDALETAPQAILVSASESLARGQGDSLHHARLLVAALRHLGIPARFAHGLTLEGLTPRPYSWVQYWDGEAFVDLDATRDTLLVPTSQIQLFATPSPEPPVLQPILKALRVERLQTSAPAPTPSPRHLP